LIFVNCRSFGVLEADDVFVGPVLVHGVCVVVTVEDVSVDASASGGGRFLLVGDQYFILFVEFLL